ncbi:MAG: carbohydrate porin, partial [Psychromonas sp.]
MNVKDIGYVCAAMLLMSPSVHAQEEQPTQEATKSTAPLFASPNSVSGQMAEDKRLDKSIIDSQSPMGYTEWKQKLQENSGLSFTLDYSAAAVGATNTLNDQDTFSGGVLRLFGQWDLIGRESANTGSLIFKVENRHGYTDPSANGVKDEIGYVGLMYPTFSDIGTRYTNFFWKQNLNEGDIEIVVGFLDATDWVDVYALASPWTGFSNFAFATGGATIALPDDAALGAYFNAMLTDEIYLITGFTDSNADSTDPLNGFDTFTDHEFIKTIELGWVTSRERFYLDNTHLTYWQSDERVAAGVNDGQGASFSYSHSFDEKWMPFFRAGYAKDGGTLLQKSV